MFNTPAKIYLTTAFLALAAAFGVSIVLDDDRVAVVLLLFLFVGALLLGLAAAGSGFRDRARPVAEGAPIERVPVGRAVLAHPSTWPIAAAFGVAVLALGAALGTAMVVAGLAVTMLAAAGWLGQAWRETPGWDAAKGSRLSARFLAPVGIPIIAVVLIAILVIPVSRVLLAVDEHVAVVVALVTALVILGLFSLLAITARLTRKMSATIAGVAIVALVAAASAGIGNGEREWENKNEPTVPVLQITAKNTSFTKQTLEVPAGKPFQLHFTNDDAGIYHNVGIYSPIGPAGAEKPVTDGEPIKGVSKTTYHFPAIASPGTYTFKCDFHANMVGTLTVG
jgi:plastocyanin